MHSSPELTITSAILAGSNLVVFLSDGRIILYPMTGMTWITEAPLEDQQDFVVTEWEIYWNQIDDGLALEHILSPKPRVDFTVEKPPNWEQFQKVLTAYQSRAKPVPQGTEEDQTDVGKDTSEEYTRLTRRRA